MDVHGETYWVLGLARSGCAAGALLRRHGARTIGLDDATEEAVGRRWDREGLSNLAPRAFDEILTGGRTPATGPAAVVVSPGVPLSHPLLQSLPGGIEVMGELELGARFCAARQVAVTGTNGKTTTTEWLAHVGRRAGLEAVALGNVGRPFSSVADELAADALAVLELSSFQLESIDRFRPEAGVVLNLAPDHLDRYPDLDSYYAAKRNLATAIGPRGSFVTWTGCAPARSWPVKGRVVLFGDGDDGAHVYYRDGQLLAALDGAAAPLLPAGEVSLQSPPNRLNALACAATALSIGLSPEAVTAGLRDFPGLAHRHELVARLGGLRFVNDTKATNVHAVCSGLRGYPRPVILIAGGSGKGEDYAPLRDVMEPVRCAVLMGDEGPAIARALTGAVATVTTGTLDEAVGEALHRASAIGGEVDILLSPACASFDQFPNYRERGEAFVRAACALGAEAQDGRPGADR